MKDLLLFRVRRELFAAELAAIEEAVDLTALRDVQQLPGSPSSARGVVTLRGVLVPLFYPTGALGVAPEHPAAALVVQDGAGRVAIVVDDVEDVLTLRDGELRPVPAAEARDIAVLRGVVRRGTMLVSVVNLSALIAACRGTLHPEAA
jgi:purine-binding chemotaxis protein CheW